MNAVMKIVLEALVLLVVCFIGGFLLGYFMRAYITWIHERAGSKSPFPPEMTSKVVGLMLGAGLALAGTTLMMLIRYKVI